MAETGSTGMSLPASPNYKNASPFSSSFRVLRFADHRSSTPSPVNHYELDEDDVLWSQDLYSDLSSAGGDSPDSTHSGFGLSDSSPSFLSDLRRRPFLTERYGLSAALSEDQDPPVHHERMLAINVPIKRDAMEAGVNTVFHQSAPMNVPAWPRGRRNLSGDLGEENDEEEDDSVAEMIPPHVIVAKSHAMSFSVFEGVGRTLKGRDLRRVRNAVFQKTGFLD
ncbi:hypothetical protein KSP39_PZI000771 [Platanthera zijinensis]|uniref:Senescence regulator n=1 Tax=Platanthera zijinensis TaxID=2320716 RepID=A0AAP0GFF2_9ASPA